jgi:membrane protease YdiL (CAAX protease family)
MSISTPDSHTPLPKDYRPPLHPDTLLKAGLDLGVVMVALAMVWVNLFRRGDLWQTLRVDSVWLALPGALAGLAFALTTWHVGRRLKATHQIVVLLEQSIDLSAMTVQHVVLFSLLAAVPEELLFRGALQPEVGVLLASVIFGALHALTPLYFLYATCAGLLLGLLAAAANGLLWAAIAAHFTIDLVMFLLLLQRRNHLF